MNFTDYIDGLDGYGRARRYGITVVLTIYNATQRGDMMYAQKLLEIIGGGKKTIFDRIKELEERGILVKRTIDRTYPYKISLELTELGTHIAETLVLLQNIE